MRQDDKDQLSALAALIFLILSSLVMLGAITIGSQYAILRLDLDKSPPTCTEPK